MRTYKCNVYITNFSTDKNLHVVRNFQIIAALKWRYCITDESWRSAWVLNCHPGQIQVIHGRDVSVVVYEMTCIMLRGSGAVETTDHLVGRDTVELVTNICHFSLSSGNVASNPLQLLLLVRFCIIYVCISNKWYNKQYTPHRECAE